MEMQALIQLLHVNDCSCVISNGLTRTFSRRGVVDIYELLRDERHFLDGSSLADRVVGKAAAALMVLGGVARLHAGVISSPALAMLRGNGVEVGYGEVVPLIGNRDRTGACPLEKLCRDEDDPARLLGIIDRFIRARAR